jgi:hypothetical protein
MRASERTGEHPPHNAASPSKQPRGVATVVLRGFFTQPKKRIIGKSFPKKITFSSFSVIYIFKKRKKFSKTKIVNNFFVKKVCGIKPHCVTLHHEKQGSPHAGFLHATTTKQYRKENDTDCR